MILNLVVRLGIFALLWWIFTEGAADSWWIGGFAVLAATLISMHMFLPQSLSFIGLCQFVPFFLWHSLKGGIDVALRASQPKLSIAPTLISYPLRLPSGFPQIFMAYVISLLPGTLAANLQGSVLTVHVLDNRGAYESSLNLLEQRVAALFGIPL